MNVIRLTLPLVAMLCMVAAGRPVVGQTIVPNGDFESWSDPWHADHWDGLNYNGTWLNFHTFSRSDDARSGNYAARIETITHSLIGTLPGLAFTGALDFNPQTFEYTIQFGVPVSGRPSSLNGYYKYLPSGGDTAVIAIGMFKWNQQTVNLDSIGGGLFFTNQEAGSYTHFGIPIQYFSTHDADTMYILMASSADTYHPGSVLLVDDLYLDYGPAAAGEPETTSFRCYPNPATDYLVVETTGSADGRIVRLTDVTGVCHHISPLCGNLTIDISRFNPGMFFLTIENETGRVYSQKIIIQY